MPGSGRSRGLRSQCTRRASRRRHSPRAGESEGPVGDAQKAEVGSATLCPEGLATTSGKNACCLGPRRGVRSCPMAQEGPSQRQGAGATLTAAPRLGSRSLPPHAARPASEWMWGRWAWPPQSAGGEAAGGQCPPPTARKASGVTLGRPRGPSTGGLSPLDICKHGAPRGHAGEGQPGPADGGAVTIRLTPLPGPSIALRVPEMWDRGPQCHSPGSPPRAWQDPSLPPASGLGSGCPWAWLVPLPNVIPAPP